MVCSHPPSIPALGLRRRHLASHWGGEWVGEVMVLAWLPAWLRGRGSRREQGSPQPLIAGLGRGCCPLPQQGAWAWFSAQARGEALGTPLVGCLLLVIRVQHGTYLPFHNPRSALVEKSFLPKDSLGRWHQWLCPIFTESSVVSTLTQDVRDPCSNHSTAWENLNTHLSRVSWPPRL